MKQHSFRTHVLTLLVIFSVVAGCTPTTATPPPPTSLPSPTFIPPTIEVPSPIPELTSTLVNTNPVWEIKENWSAANQIRAMLIDQNDDLWTGGPAGVVHWDLKTNTPTAYAIRNNPKNTNVIALSQAPDGGIWAGTLGNGLARFDGEQWQSFTTENGLPGNYIVSQTVSPKGDIWLATQKDKYSGDQDKDYAFGRFDGSQLIKENIWGFSWIFTLPDGSKVLATGVRSQGFSSGIWIDNGKTSDLVYGKQEYNPLQSRIITAVTVAPDESIWTATRGTILGMTPDFFFHFVNGDWQVIEPPEHVEDLPQVSSIAVSSDGVAWFGFSLYADDIDYCGSRWSTVEEQGVYRHDGKNWTHLTTRDGLVDNKICAITIDQNNNVWFGSFDKGVSRFDGKTWTSYVVP